jgi:DNA-directed RNA polymerase II subunit RPB1
MTRISTSKHDALVPSRIIGIQFSVLSPEEIRNGSVAEITSRDTYINNKPIIGGLFDPRMGVLDPGLICPTDGLNYMDTPGYFGHIELAKPVYYIQYLETIKKILRCICFKCSKLLIDKEKFAHYLNYDSKKRWKLVFKQCQKIKRCGECHPYGCGCKQPKKIYKNDLASLWAEWENTDGIKDDDGKVKDKPSVKLSPEDVLKKFRRISDEDVNFMGFSNVWSRPEWFICQVLAVPPPAVRPSVKHDSQQRSEDDISHIIVNIIKANTTLAEKINKNSPIKVIEDWATVLQYYIATMVDNKIPGVASVAQRSGRALKSIKERLVGKQGRVRGNLMGKRCDFTARSVISPDATLKINELGIPMKVAKTITFPAVVNKRNKKFLTKLLQNGPDVYPGANILEKKGMKGDGISLRYIDRKSQILNEGDILHRHMMDGDPILFNRQPTLHRMSMMCHRAKIMKKGSTFRMNVADTKPYNADFDGDEMNLHGPQDEESQAELLHLAYVPKQIISPANNSSIIGIFQDSLLGCYRFTRENINFDLRTAMNISMYFDNPNLNILKNKKNKKISNFEILTQILPPMSIYNKNGQLGDNEDKKKTNNIIEIKNGEYIRGQIDKGVLGKGSEGLIQSIFNDYGDMKSAKFIDDIQAIVTEYMKLSSYSVGISDLISDNETTQKITDSINKKKKEVYDLIDQLHISTFENNTGKPNVEVFEDRVNAIVQNAAGEAGKIGRANLDKNNRFVLMVNAGSKGSNINIAQMISCLGQQAVDGKRIPYGFEDRTLPHYTKYDDSPEARGFVESSFIQGLTPEETYFHAMGGRTGLIDTAVKTSQTGYIQRRLIKGLEDLKVNYDMTVRNNKNKIIQFSYGDDNIVTTKTETQKLPISQMSIEQIYKHFQMPDYSKDSTIRFSKKANTTLKKQKDTLAKKTKEIIEFMLAKREDIIKHVYNYKLDTNVYLPVAVKRLINNVKNNLHIKNNYFIDITPLDVYNKIDDLIEQLHITDKIKPTDLFKALLYYYLSPTQLLLKHRFSKKAVEILIEKIIFAYKKAVVHPGEMVGMIAAQSIGEPTTQMTLNTFHFAGVASKSNVTRGVPRIEEILSLSENPKQPSTTIYLHEKDQLDKSKAQELKYQLEYTCLKDVTKSVSICFDPKLDDTIISQDALLVKQYYDFEKVMSECGLDDNKSTSFSKWILRFELSREEMLDRGINMDDIHFAIKNSIKPSINCIYSDFNDNNLIFRIRIMDFLDSKNIKKNNTLDQTDEIYKLKNLQEHILKNVILRGVKNIPKVLLRKVPNTAVKENGNYQSKDIWVLDTVGSNLKEILTYESIDVNKTFSNDIQEVYKVLGIEAARLCVHNELIECFAGVGKINYHHTTMLCDRICATQKMVSIFRHGINNDDIGPIAKASFEETPEMFLKAAKHAELDLMTGVSANVMCGQEGYFGTGSFQVLLDHEEIMNMVSTEIADDTDIDSLLNIQEDGVCSKENLVIKTVVSNTVNNTGVVDNDYDFDL